jgi:hypothetical protein
MSLARSPLVLDGMFRFALAASLFLPSVAVAQSWTDALQAKDYARAAAALQEIVSGLELMIRPGPPEPFTALAVLYHDGLGVHRDPVMACALATTADMAVDASRYPSDAAGIARREAAIAASAAFVASICNDLPAADRTTALRSSAPGCYAFGMQEQVLALTGATVRVGRHGLSMVDDPDSLVEFWCMPLVSSVQHLSVAPPRDAMPGMKSRDFIEVRSWSNGRSQDGEPRFHAVSRIFEVRGRTIRQLTEASLREVSGWPAGQVIAPTSYEMLRSGHVRWKVDGDPPRRGWLMLPDQEIER